MIFKKLLSKQAIKSTKQYKYSNQIKQIKHVTNDNILVNKALKTVFVSPYHVQPFNWKDYLDRK